MIVTELLKGIKLYLLVGGKGERLSSVTNGYPKPLVNVNDKPFISYVLDNLKGFDITLVCSDSTYDYFKNLDVEVLPLISTNGLGVPLVTEERRSPLPPTKRYNLIPFDNSVTIIVKMLC